MNSIERLAMDDTCLRLGIIAGEYNSEAPGFVVARNTINNLNPYL